MSQLHHLVAHASLGKMKASQLSAISQAPQLSAISQAPQLSAVSQAPQLCAISQAPRLPTVSQAPQLPAVSVASPVPQHYASSLVPQHSAAHSPSLLSTGSTSQPPPTLTTHQVSRTTKWRRKILNHSNAKCTFANTEGNQQQVQCF